MKKTDFLILSGLAVAVYSAVWVAPTFEHVYWFRGSIFAGEVVIADDAIKYSGWLAALALWAWFWARWKKQHPSQGVLEALGDFLDTAIAKCWRVLRPGMTRMKAATGTVLFILGIGLVVAELPDALRYVVQENSGLDYSLFGFYLAVGTVLLVGGWFLRRSGLSR